MLLLDAASKLQLTLSATGSVDYTVSKVRNASPFLPVPTKGNITAVGPTDICAVPGGTDVDTVECITLNNVHATVTVDVTVTHVGGTTIRVFKVASLAPGEYCVWNENGTIFVYDALGRVKVGGVSGTFLQSTLLTTGTTFTTGPNTNKIKIKLVGAGGGGSGCTSVASAACGGGGGGAASYAEKVFAVTPNTAYTYAIGAAGTGASGAAGNNGGDTTFTVGATTVTGKGGGGAPIGTAATTLVARAGGAGGTVALNGDLNSVGQPGEFGIVLITATPIVASGNGGDSPMGGGGLGLVAVGNGNNAGGFGAGGGGSATGASTVRTGGNGTAGAIIVEEYA